MKKPNLGGSNDCSFLVSDGRHSTRHDSLRHRRFVRNYTTHSDDAYIFPSREYLLAVLLLTATIVLHMVI